MLRKTKIFNRAAALLSCVSLALGLSLPINAASSTLSLTNLEVVNASETATTEDLDFAYNSITGNIRLKQINDSITLALTLENISDITYKITSIEDNITGDYMSTEYNFNEDAIAPGETTTVNAVITYTNTKDGKSSFKIKDYSIIINLISEDGESQLVINPGTGDSIISAVAIVIAVSVFAVAALVLIKNKRTKALIAVFALSGTALLSTTIYADTTDVAEVRIASIAFGEKTLSDITTMQEMTHSICEASEVNEKNSLVDTREGEVNSYVVAKAADNKCWMVQNLKLGSNTSIGDSLEINKVSNTTGEENGTFSLTGKVATSTGFARNSNYTYDSPQFSCTNDGNCHYNWAAATAGTGLSDLANGSSASDSICPKGWVLPSVSQYNELLNAYPNASERVASNITNSAGAIPGFTISSIHDTSGFFDDNRGHFWTRVADSAGAAHALYIQPNGGASAEAMSGSRYLGYSVRCVAY